MEKNIRFIKGKRFEVLKGSNLSSSEIAVSNGYQSQQVGSLLGRRPYYPITLSKATVCSVGLLESLPAFLLSCFFVSF